MNNRTKFLTAAGILAASLSQVGSYSSAMNPNLKKGFEKCYGVSKAGKNDCVSKVRKHACSGMSKVDSDKNEWVKVPKGLCMKLVGGSPVAASEVGNKDESDDKHGNHKH